jgi:hypothetical protein
MVPESMKTMIKKLLKLGFKEKPPYDELLELILTHIVREFKVGEDLNPIRHEYEWQHTMK